MQGGMRLIVEGHCFPSPPHSLFQLSIGQQVVIHLLFSEALTPNLILLTLLLNVAPHFLNNMRRHTGSTPTSTSTNDIPAKRRLAIVAGTDVSPKDILNMPDEELNYAFLLKHNIPVANIRVGGFTLQMLKERGAKKAHMLNALGFDALHLVNADFLTEAVSLYGSRELVSAFLKTPYDAVALADASVMQILSLTTGRLMEECAGYPAEGVAILHQIKSIEDISITTLLDSGIRGSQLRELGYTYQEVQKATGASLAQMGTLEMKK